MSEERPSVAARLPQGLVVRPLEAGDSIEELTALCHRAYRELLDSGLRYVAATQDVQTTRSRIEGAECTVGTLGGSLVATVTLYPPGRGRGCAWYERPDVACFFMLCVDPSLRRRGIAAALMDRVEARARDLWAREVACDTALDAAHLIAMYEARGYRQVERVSWDATNYDSVILSKAL